MLMLTNTFDGMGLLGVPPTLTYLRALRACRGRNRKLLWRKGHTSTLAHASLWRRRAADPATQGNCIAPGRNDGCWYQARLIRLLGGCSIGE